MSDQSLRRVTHYGNVKFGEIACEAVVLNDGTRGFVQRQFAKLLGYNPKNPGNRFRDFVKNFAPNALSVQEKTQVTKVQMPNGPHAGFIDADLVTDLVTGVIEAAVNGRTHHKQKPAVNACLKIQASMAKVGLNALIDEATGYQYHRAPDALQVLFSKLLRQQAASWERRFHPDFYRAIYRLFGWKYAGHDQNPPSIVGQITYDWVYAPVMPMAMIEELRSRKALSDKHHQWLSAEACNYWKARSALSPSLPVARATTRISATAATPCSMVPCNSTCSTTCERRDVAPSHGVPDLREHHHKS